VIATGVGNWPTVLPVRPAVIRKDADHNMIIVGNPSADIPTGSGNPTAATSRRSAVASNDPDRNMTKLSKLLDHMDFTVATLISSNADDPGVVPSRTLADFQAAVRDNTRLISQQQRDQDQGLS
jgi:hypothetical protein